MPHIRGMKVELHTHYNPFSGTDDHIYIGVYGTDGGREFPLDAPGDDFDPVWMSPTSSVQGAGDAAGLVLTEILRARRTLRPRISAHRSGQRAAGLPPQTSERRQ